MKESQNTFEPFRDSLEDLKRAMAGFVSSELGEGDNDVRAVLEKKGVTEIEVVDAGSRKREALIIGAVLFHGRIEILPEPTGTFEVRCVLFNSSGVPQRPLAASVSTNVYFDDAAAFGNALKKAWDAGSNASGRMPSSKESHPHLAPVSEQERTLQNFKAVPQNHNSH